MIDYRSTQFDLLAWAAAGGITSYLEVGVQEGRSLQVVLDNAVSLQRIALVDTWGSESGGSGRGSHRHILPRLEKHAGIETKIYDGDSRHVLPTLNERYDLVHIDGGHSYEVALSDIIHGWKRTGVMMLVHDISFADVWRALYDFLAVQTELIEVRIHFGGNGSAVLVRSGR